MRLAVVGSRTFNDYDTLRKHLDALSVSVIVSGGAQGADRLSERYATERNIPLSVHYAEWNKYGRSAGPIRNKRIVEDSDGMIAFWDGESRGTLSSIRLAKNKGIPVSVVRF